MSLLPLSPELNDLLAGYGLGTGGLADILGRGEPAPLSGPPPPAAARGFGGMNRGQWGEFLGTFGDILTGYPLAERMMQRRQQAEQIRRQRILDELALQRERRLAEQEQRQAEHQDIATRMALGEAGYRPLEPGEEPQEPIGRYQIGATGPPVQINKRPVEEYGGRRYVGPSPYERRKEALIAQELKQAEEGRKAKAAQEQAAAVETARQEVRKKYAPPPKPTAAVKPYPFESEQGLMLVSPEGVATPVRTAEGAVLKKAKGTTGGEGTVARERLDLARQQSRAKELTDLEAREEKAAKDVADLRTIVNDAEADDAVKKAAQGRLALKEGILKRIRQQKVDKGFTTAEDAGLSPPKKTAPQQAAAPKKTATLAQLKAFAAAKGITEVEARKRFAAEGYEVQ